ncbi:MAG: 30S ribosomal protein S12 methylthiotransferase RimO [Acidobacteria bacterium]|nr:30S ribosomal protein S12 methylthiotransferase RimO [Acidobacteriota bacterium]
MQGVRRQNIAIFQNEPGNPLKTNKTASPAPTGPPAQQKSRERTQRRATPVQSTPPSRIAKPSRKRYPGGLKIGFVSLGCPKNLVDTEVMMGRLTAHGHELTPRPEEADVIVINTCSFIDPAKQESVDTIIEMGRYKTEGRAQRLVVAGCLVERYRGDIRQDLPEVDAIIGTNDIGHIVAACEGEPLPAAPSDPYLYHDLTPRVLTTPRHSAYIKIAEGCDHPCTFCVIPQYRGKFRSRRFESVAAEATRMFASGVREINLIGQDTTSYGEDLGLRDGLAQLLARLAQIETPFEKWIRVLYVYPNRVTPRLIDTIAQYPALVKYIDMPLQHASGSVLKRMKRGSNGDFFLKILERIRAAIPGVAIRSSFITGFPGESNSDFEELCQFVQAARFDRVGVFSYSDEDTSASFALDGKIAPRDIYNRKRRLMAIQRRISRTNNRALVGREFTVLVEGRSQETDLLWEARLPTQAPDIDGVCYINDDNGTTVRAGEMRRIRITEAHDYDLVGEITGQPEAALPERPAAPLFPILSSHSTLHISRGQAS